MPTKKILKIATIIFLLIAAGCANIKHKSRQPVESLSRHFTVVVTGNTSGEFAPSGCGCRSRGGLSRRASLLRKVRMGGTDTAVFDTGNLLSDTDLKMGNEKELKARYMLMALEHMKTDAVNVGATDCSIGVSFLQSIQKNLGLDLISANIRFTENGKPVFKQYTIKDVNGVKIGVFGLSGHGNPLSLKSEGVLIANPLQSARESVKQLKQRGCSPVILLSQLSQAENLRIARMVPGIDFIFGNRSIPVTGTHIPGYRANILPAGRQGRDAGIMVISINDPTARYYNIKTIKEVEQKIVLLSTEQDRHEKPADRKRASIEIAELKKKLGSLNNGNSFIYSIVSLDNTITEDKDILLIGEQYRQEVAKRSIPGYRETVDGVDLSGLSEAERLLALRLMNTCTCNGSMSIAQMAGKDKSCTRLADMIVGAVKQGQAEGLIRYHLIREQEKSGPPAGN